jgi:hypothetical protein
VLLLALCAIATEPAANAQQTQAGTARFTCPDDSSIVIASNVAGTTDKVVTVAPTGSDQTFRLEVFNPSTGVVLDSVEIDGDNHPPITMPPGSKARAVDAEDSGSIKPTGTVTMSSAS